MTLLCCREAEPDIFPAYSEDLSSASQDWSHGDLNNDTEASCSACSHSQIGQCHYPCYKHEPTQNNAADFQPSATTRHSMYTIERKKINDMTQHVEHQAQKNAFYQLVSKSLRHWRYVAAEASLLAS